MNPRVVLVLLLLGVLLGPATGVLNDATLHSLAPVLALCLGWTGAAFGSRFQWRLVRRIPRSAWMASAAQAGAAFLAVAAGAALLAFAVPGLRAAWRPLAAVVLALGAVAAVSGPGAVAWAARAAGVDHARTKALATAATLDTVLGTVAFMLAVAIDHPRGPLAGPLGAATWLLLALGSGVLVGLLFLGLAPLREPHGLTLAMLGAVLLGAGAGYAAGLSPFVVCAVAAAVIANRSAERRAVAARLRAWEPALYAILLILAGALLGLTTWWIVPAAAVLAAIRVGARWAAGRYGRRVTGNTGLPPDVGLAGVAQGGVALALGINLLLLYLHGGAGAPDAVLTTVVLGIVLAQLAAPFLMRRAMQAPELTARPAPAEVS